jgi:hypothetical protein
MRKTTYKLKFDANWTNVVMSWSITGIWLSNKTPFSEY